MKYPIPTKSLWTLAVCICLVLNVGVSTVWAQYTAGNLVVLRAGDGSAALSSAATPVFLVEYSPTSGSAVNTLAMPTTVSGANARLTISGSAGSEGALSRSADGRYLTLVGYDAATATSGVASATGVSRVVGRVDYARSINTTTVLPQSVAYTANNIRSAVSNDGTQFWTAGTGSGSSGGVRYTTLGATDGGIQVSTSPTNTRVVNIYDGQLYITSSTGSFTGVSSVGTGLPTSTSQITTLKVGETSTNGPYAFVFLDRDASVPGVDVLYIADQSSGILKFSFDGSVWTARGSVTGVATGLTGAINGNAVDLYVTVGTGAGNTLYKVSDAATNTAAITGNGTAITAAGTLIATAPANTVFRGVAFAPVNPLPDLSVTLAAPASATLNQPFDYSVVVANTGSMNASGITVQFSLPSSTSATYINAGVANGFTANQAGGIVTFSGGTLSAGASTTLTVTVTPIANGNMVSGTALVDPANTIAESDETNNTAAAVATTVSSVNQAPMPPTLPDQTGTTGVPFSYTVPAFTDPDNQASTTFSLSINAAPAGIIQITEYMYSSANGAGNGVGEFVELTNVGNAPIDLTGWSFDDNSRQPGSFTGVSTFGVVQPNESVIITDATAAQFRTYWFLPTSVKVVGGNDQNLGRSDEINMYDASNALVARLTFNDQGTSPSGTVRTQFVSAWPQRNLLGQTNTGGWQLSVGGDAQNSYTATTGDVGNPGGYFIPLNRVLVYETLNSTTVVEAGATDTYTVALNSQPSADVTIAITNPGSPLNISPSSPLVFTSANYNVPQTVTVSATNDGITQGTRSVTITQSASSADPAYNGIAVNPVSVTIVDAQAAVPVSISATVNSAYLNLPTNGPAYVSGVLNDPTDPATTIGLNFTLSAATDLTVVATSSNASVVPDANLVLTGSGASRTLKITPVGVGYATITLTASSVSASGTYVVYYAASAASTTPSSTHFHTGTSDASTAVVIDANYMLVGDDENQVLRLYNRQNSGLPINGFDYTASLGLTDISGGIPREVDIEASVVSGSRIFWIGSQSNKEGGGARPDRDRVFATDITGTGANTTLSYVARYDYLREDIIAWDVNNLHGKGANYYGLEASAASTADSKAPSGYNIEGAEFAPDGTAVYIGFRAPQVPLPERRKALVVPVTNLTGILAANGGTQGSATFGAPIELDLGGRGIREIRKNAANQYLIIAGPAGDAGVAPNDFRLFTWTGVPTDAPVLRGDNFSTMTVDGGFESIVEVPATLADDSQIQVLVDNGTALYYGDGVAAKDLTVNNFKKFRSDVVTLGPVQTLGGPDLTPSLTMPQNIFTASGPDAIRNFVFTVAEVGGEATVSGSILLTVTAPLGYTLSFDNTITSIDVSGGSTTPVDNTHWSINSNQDGQQISILINAGQFIAANSSKRIGFTITRTTANSGSVSNISVNIADDTSNNYDRNPANNTYARIINGL